MISNKVTHITLSCYCFVIVFVFITIIRLLSLFYYNLLIIFLNIELYGLYNVRKEKFICCIFINHKAMSTNCLYISFNS